MSIEIPNSMDILQPGSNFDQTIQSANTARFFPSGSTTFNDNNRNISIRLSSSDYIRPQTACLLFTLKLSNAGQVPEDMVAVQSLGNVTLECGGRVVENIMNAGMCLYPIIVHKTPASVYRSTLSLSGAYKYKPSYQGFLQYAETGRSVKFGQADYNTVNAEYGTNAMSSWPRTNIGSGNSFLQDVANYPNNRGLTLTDVSDVVEYLERVSDYMCSGNQISFCKPDPLFAFDPTGDGLDFGAPLKVFTDPAGVGTTGFAVCSNNRTQSQSIGSLVIANSMPIHNQPSAIAKDPRWGAGLSPVQDYPATLLQQGALGLGHPCEAEGLMTRTYGLYLKDVLGLFNSPRLLPLRNMGSMVLNIQLRPYSEWFIHVLPSNAGNYLAENSLAGVNADNGTVGAPPYTARTPELQKLLDSNQLDYTISNVRLCVDTCRPNDAFVQKVDEMCAGSEGLSIVYTSRETSVTPVNYNTNIQITSTRAYSFLKCIYTSFQESLTSQSVYLSKSDRMLGSRFIRGSTVIGSTTYPLINIESASEAFSECKKACQKPNSIGDYPEDSVVDLAIYTGKRAVLGTSDSFSSAGLFPSLPLVKKTNTYYKLKQSSQSHTQAPSCFLFCQNVDRVLQAGVSFSGLSTRTSGFSITTNLEFQPFTSNQDPTDVSGYSILNPAYLDAHLGNCALRACTVFEFDCLLRLANSSVEVRN